MEDAAVRAVSCALEDDWLPCVGVAFTGHPRPLPKTKHMPRRTALSGVTLTLHMPAFSCIFKSDGLGPNPASPVPGSTCSIPASPRRQSQLGRAAPNFQLRLESQTVEPSRNSMTFDPAAPPTAAVGPSPSPPPPQPPQQPGSSSQ